MASATFKFTISNLGNLPTGTVVASVDGANAADFQPASSTCGSPLQYAASCEVTISFAPDMAGAKSARLVVSGTPGGNTVATLSGIAQAPAAAILTPSQVTFDSVLALSAANTAMPPAPAKGMFTLTNAGGVPSGPFSVDIGGKDAADFAVTDSSTCATTLDPKATCTILVSFRPGTPGSKSAVLNANSTDGTLKLSAALSGIATDRAVLTLTPAAQMFGSVPVGLKSSMIFTVENKGGTTSGKIAYTMSGVNFAEFMLDTTGCPDTLDPGANCALSVTFSPIQIGAKAASLRLSATPGGTLSADLTAMAVSASTLGMLSVTSAGAEPFGTVPVGGTSLAAFIVENKGITAAGKVSATISGANFNEFMVTDNQCPMSLDAGASCIVMVSFTPQASGMRTGSIQVAATPGGFASLAIAADAVDGATLDITPGTKNFGNFGVNAGNSNPTSFTVTNKGDTVSGPITVTIEGTDAASFNIAFTDCGMNLQKDKTCRVDVRFNPLMVGNKIASLTVTAMPGGVARASLYGNGN